MADKFCIYHGNCPDGFTSAWVLWRKFGEDNIDFFAGTYQKDPPFNKIVGKDVYMVDFSYKRPVLEQIRDLANSVTILDHHKTAEADLKDLPGVNTIFDMKRSGCGITWDYFYPGRPAPEVLLRVQDRDLWEFKLDRTRTITAYIFANRYDFNVWEELMWGNMDKMHEMGCILQDKLHKDIEEVLKITTRRMIIGGYNVPVANMPHIFASEAGNVLTQGEPFGVIYYDTPDGRTFSLRSTDAGVDVSEIAKKYGGGGHRNASGFKVSYEEAKKFEI